MDFVNISGFSQDGLFHIFRGDIVQGPSIIHGASVGLFVKLQKGAPEGGLPAAGFTDQPQCLSFINVEGDAVIGFDV